MRITIILCSLLLAAADAATKAPIQALLASVDDQETGGVSFLGSEFPKLELVAENLAATYDAYDAPNMKTVPEPRIMKNFRQADHPGRGCRICGQGVLRAVLLRRLPDAVPQPVPSGTSGRRSHDGGNSPSARLRPGDGVPPGDRQEKTR